MALKIIFAGTSEFAVAPLQTLLDSEHTICAVYTKPDRMAGRGLRVTASPVKEFAMLNELVLEQPENLRDKKEQSLLKDYGADIFVNVAYGLYLPPAVLKMFRYGCINIHPSLLPRWRGAAPIQRSILAGDVETGVTIMQVDEGWDTGDILKQATFTIGAADTAAELERCLARVGSMLLLDVLDGIEKKTMAPKVQDESLSCYADKLKKEEGMIDWRRTAAEIDCKIRAFNPWPIAFTKVGDVSVRIWKAVPLDLETKLLPGTVVKADKNGIDVITGQGVLRILELQLPGRKVLTAEQLLNSKKDLFQIGICLNG